MQVYEGREKLTHNKGSFLLTEVFLFEDEVEEFSTLAIPIRNKFMVLVDVRKQFLSLSNFLVASFVGKIDQN